MNIDQIIKMNCLLSIYMHIFFFLCKHYYFEWNSHNIPGSASLGL